MDPESLKAERNARQLRFHEQRAARMERALKWGHIVVSSEQLNSLMRRRRESQDKALELRLWFIDSGLESPPEYKPWWKRLLGL